MSRVAAVVLVLAGSLWLGSCSLGDDGAGTPQAGVTGGTNGTDVGTGDGVGTDVTDGTGVGTGEDATAEAELVEGMRDGVWPVADVGEIEFELTPQGLELVQMRPSAGWQVVDEEVGPDEIEIDLRSTDPTSTGPTSTGPTSTDPTSTDVRTTVEVGYQSGILEIEVDQVLDPPPDGPLQLGEAGTVELVVAGEDTRVGEVRLQAGWRETQRSADDQDAELGLRRNRPGVTETWEVDARVDDGGLEVHTDREIQGRASP